MTKTVHGRSSSAVRPPSPEQEVVIRSLRTDDVFVEAVAGAGKTTTVLHVARDVAPDLVLLITYSRRLCDETRSRAEGLGVTNLVVHTYHSLAVRHYARDAHTDEGMRVAIRSNKAPYKPFPDFRLVVVDEAQDMSPLYLELTLTALADVVRANRGCRPRLLVMGDRRQNIYRFKGADERFLTLARDAFGPPESGTWVSARLGRTYRCNPGICSFLNRVMVGERLLEPGRPAGAGRGVRYMRCNAFGGDLHHAVEDMIRRHGNDNVFILAPSVRTAGPIRTLSNQLTARGIPVFKPMDDAERLDDEVMRGKVVMCTFHQSKGLERDAVVVLGADACYFTYYAPGRDPATCPNELYVAMSRARDELLVVHHHAQDFLPFLDAAELLAGHHEGAWVASGVADLPDFEKPEPPSPSVPPKKAKDWAVTDLLRHLSEEATAAALACLEVVQLRPAAEEVDIPCKVKQPSGLVESVCEITGTAIPAAFEFERKGAISIARKCPGATGGGTGKRPSAAQLLLLANQYCSHVSGYAFKAKQITDYGWLTEEALLQCVDRLRGVIKEDAEFEVTHKLGHQGRPQLRGRDLRGALDAVTRDTVYEIKCTGSLSPEHTLQLAIYGYMLGEAAGAFRSMLIDALQMPWDADPEVVLKFAALMGLRRPFPKDSEDMFDFVCANALRRLRDEHGVQVAKDGSLPATLPEPLCKRLVLYNLRSDEMVEVRAGQAALRRAVDIIIAAKTAPEDSHCDATFLAGAARVRERVRTRAGELEASDDEPPHEDYDDDEDESGDDLQGFAFL